MTGARVAVIVNPAARSGTSRSAADRAIARLTERGCTVSAFHGMSADETRAALARAREGHPDTIVVIGGDGTVRLALEAMHGSGIPLALIPVGTGNDLATALRIPRDPVAAADLVCDGEPRMLDAARLSRPDGSTEIFGSVFASGFDSKVNERANRMRWPQGRARYNIAIAIEFALLKSIAYRIRWSDADGAEGEFSGPLLLTAVGNTSSYGGGIPICPAADPADGMLDLTIVRPASRLRLVRVLAKAFTGRHIDEPEVLAQRVRTVRIDAPGLTGYADGDPMGPLPVTIEVLPDAVLLRLPPRA